MQRERREEKEEKANTLDIISEKSVCNFSKAAWTPKSIGATL